MQTIMLVEDSKTMLLCLSNALELKGYKVVTAENGKIALDRIKTGLRPDLIITDVNMPVMGGLEFIAQVRPIVRFTPILTLTTESQMEKRNEARRLGATGWMVKPIAIPKLIEAIERVLPSKVAVAA